VWLIRMPRIVLAVGVGAGLSVVGIVMQAIVKNPLADPYILGVSSGASLGATLSVFLGIGSVISSNAIGVMGFIGAFSISILVLIISNIGGRSNSTKLLLAGAKWEQISFILPIIILGTIFFITQYRTLNLMLLGDEVSLIWADVFSRIIIKGTEIPIGIVISVIGAPLFLYLMIKKDYGFGGKKE